MRFCLNSCTSLYIVTKQQGDGFKYVWFSTFHYYQCYWNKHQLLLKSVHKWVVGGAEAPPNFCHLYTMQDVVHSAQLTTVLMCSES